MDNLELLRKLVDESLRSICDPERSRDGFVHLYGVSAICVMLAVKRGLDPEICAVAGMLHDISNYTTGENPEHAALSAIEAKKILNSLPQFPRTVTNRICRAIARHSDKQTVHSNLDELLKDADVLQHYLYNPTLFDDTYQRAAWQSSPEKPMRLRRLDRVMAELNIG
jgi:uncharacterized protein